MRIFLPPELIASKTGIILPEDKARHIATVMRAVKGDELLIIDGCGRTYLAAIAAINRKSVSIDIIQETQSLAEPPVRLILCQAILKGEKMDLVVQKATELGVSEIIPVITERSQVRQSRKAGRWRKIAEESVEQCGRSVMPVIREEIGFETLLRETKTGGIIFWEGGGIRADRAVSSLAQADGSINICIGPEGGFSLAEVEAAEAVGFVRATLGSLILRAETAAIAGVALVRFLAEKGPNDCS